MLGKSRLILNLQTGIKLFLIVILYSCATSEFRITEFKFKHNNENYIVRSAYCPNNPESCNQLIGKDFMAIDLNLDRIIDEISMGKIKLAQAQKIYDYSLLLLQKRGKLNEINRNYESFVFDDEFYEYEIKSFISAFKSPFNEFKIESKKGSYRNKEISVSIDYGADGILDEKVKGMVEIKEAQSFYNIVIEKGIELGELIKSNGTVVSK